MKENQLLKLYLELKNKVLEEKRVILLGDFESKNLNKLIMNKRVIRDKIEKMIKKNKNIDDNSVDDNNNEKIKNVIKELLKLEEENRYIYIEKMKENQEKMKNLYTERKLKNTYIQSKPLSRVLDEKK